MRRILQSTVVTTGLAMFSMFFGAGNVVFPLAIGHLAGDKNIYAISGLLLTAVGVPFLGLVGMILFDGDYKAFFYRIGKVPGFIAILVVIVLLGPFAALPRLITLSYSTMQELLPANFPLFAFSIIASIIIFVLSLRKGTLLSLLGNLLSPILLFALGLIILVGCIASPAAPIMPFGRGEMIGKGIIEGFLTMDLLAAVFFSSIVLEILKSNLHADHRRDVKKVATLALKAGCIGAALLGVVYVGMSFVASFNSGSLEGIGQDALIRVVSYTVLGSYGGIVASIAVSLACLTTAITLTMISADFFREEIFVNTISYRFSLGLTCGITALVSLIGFGGIVQFLKPILNVCYPAIFVLAMLNIAYKLFDFKPVKIPVFGAFIIMLLITITSYIPK